MKSKLWLLMLSLVVVAPSAMALKCEEEFNGGGDRRSHKIWERVLQSSLARPNPYQIRVVGFFQKLKELGGRDIKLPYDEHGMRSYEVRPILQVLSRFNTPVQFTRGNETHTGLLMDGDGWSEEFSAGAEISILEAKKNETTDITFEFFNSGRFYGKNGLAFQPYTLTLTHGLPPQLSEKIGSDVDTFALVYRVQFPEVAKVLDQLESRGTATFEGGAKIGLDLISALNYLGLEIEVSQKNLRAQGRFLKFNYDLSAQELNRIHSWPYYEAKTITLVFLKRAAHKIAECAERIDFLAKSPALLSSNYERENHYRLRQLCTNEVQLSLNEPFNIEMW